MDRLKKIKNCVNNSKIEWSIHAAEKMIKCRINSNAVIEAVTNGEIIEDYQKSILILGWFNNQPIHVVCFHHDENDSVFITTVYRPDQFHFESDFKTRRKP